MHPRTTLITLVVVALPTMGRSECQVTLPRSSPVAVPTLAGASWYGSELLAVRLPDDGIWRQTGPDGVGYGTKLWFWRRGYEARSENRPKLTLEASKLDAGDSAERVEVHDATNAMGPGWSKMLTGISFPSEGCWRITATYTFTGIRQELTFVAQVVFQKATRAGGPDVELYSFQPPPSAW